MKPKNHKASSSSKAPTISSLLSAEGDNWAGKEKGENALNMQRCRVHYGTIRPRKLNQHRRKKHFFTLSMKWKTVSMGLTKLLPWMGPIATWLLSAREHISLQVSAWLCKKRMHHFFFPSRTSQEDEWEGTMETLRAVLAGLSPHTIDSVTATFLFFQPADLPSESY